jgi:hypothetical protein
LGAERFLELRLHGPIRFKGEFAGIPQTVEVAGVMGHSRPLLGHRLLDRFLGITDDPTKGEPPRLDRSQDVGGNRRLAAGG